jgi:exopolysaccharide biosynthesis predicted pyruvyltransferase EpsI
MKLMKIKKAALLAIPDFPGSADSCIVHGSQKLIQPVSIREVKKWQKRKFTN